MQTATAVLCMRVNRASALRQAELVADLEGDRTAVQVPPSGRFCRPTCSARFAARRGGVAGRGRRGDGLGVGIGEVDGELVMRCGAGRLVGSQRVGGGLAGVQCSGRRAQLSSV